MLTFNQVTVDWDIHTMSIGIHGQGYQFSSMLAPEHKEQVASNFQAYDTVRAHKREQSTCTIVSFQIALEAQRSLYKN